jgi:hypothetical protein
MANREQRNTREKKKPKQDKDKKTAQPAGFSAQLNQTKAPQGTPQQGNKK